MFNSYLMNICVCVCVCVRVCVWILSYTLHTARVTPAPADNPGFFKRISNFDADVVAGIIGGFVLFFGLLFTCWACVKRRAEK